ncbi:hypothetical protein ACTJIJ_19785 [Niabella sp. 22666]|uniref:hypothetical protein n=1 Tax=Niabella sp. 22666 TaxID=3453954 RepID=UPI003F866599
MIFMISPFFPPMLLKDFQALVKQLEAWCIAKGKQYNLKYFPDIKKCFVEYSAQATINN